MNAIRLALVAVLLSACGSGPRVPDWQINAASATERASSAYMEGKSAIADREFALARNQVGSTALPEHAIRVELLRCAVQVASLVFEDCAGFNALAQDASAADHAYARYLAGSATPADAALLPEAQRPVAAAASDPAAAAAATAIKDPLSRMVAAGALLRSNRATPEVITAAIDTAASQGWRRAVLAWLNVQLKRAEQAGDEAEADRLRRRIKLASTP